MSPVTAYRVVASHDSDPTEIMRETSKRKCAADAHVSHLPRIGDLVYGLSRKADPLLASFPGFVPPLSLFVRRSLRLARVGSDVSKWLRGTASHRCVYHMLARDLG